MSPSTESSEARATWIQLVETLLEQLKTVFDFEHTLTSELEFREEFWKLPDEFNSPNVDRNWGIFLRLHGQIMYMVQTLDKSIALESPQSLSDVFWTYALAALQSVMKHDYEFADLLDIYSKLNSNDDIPAISSDAPQFPRSIAVQKPLQKIIRTYFDCYLTFVSQFALASSSDDIEEQPIFDKISEAHSSYKEGEAQWRTRLQEAIEDQKKRVTSATSTEIEHRDPRFEHLRELGRGAYGVVDEIREITTGSVYARKSVPIHINGQDSDIIEKRVINEVGIMTKLRHNHIASVNIVFKDDEYWSLIMLPVADCDLRVFLDERCVKAGYPRDVLRMLDPWFGCLISALSYAHTEMVKHEDIKPQNVLIKGKKVFLTDFGTAKDFSELEKSTVSDHFEAGTPVYWAPEPRAWGRPADVFALGCVFSEMLTVRQRRSLQEYRRFRYTSNREFGYAYRSNLPKVFEWLTKQLSINRRDPAAQLILEQTLNMLVEDPTQRLEARRIKALLRSEEGLFCITCY